MSAPTLSSEPTAPIEDGWLDTASGAAISTAIEPNTNPVLCEARDSKAPDSSPDSEPSAPLPIADWAPIMEFTTTDIFQHSPFGDILNSLKSLSLYQESPGRTMVSKAGMRTTKKFDSHPPPTL